MQIFKRVFSKKQPQNVTKSIRCTLDMWNAIEHLAAKAGESPNAYIVLILDQFLQLQLENGELELPPDTEKSVG